MSKNGYTPIPNTIFEALIRAKIPIEPRRIFDFIMRKTYGFVEKANSSRKKADSISLSQFEKATYMPRSNICRGIRILIAKKMIFRKRIKGGITQYKINEDTASWIVSQETRVSGDTSQTRQSGSVSGDNQVVSQETHTKEIYTKENITKKNMSKYSKDFEKFWREYPVNRPQHRDQAFHALIDELKSGEPFEMILQATINYAEAMKRNKTDNQYVRHPQNFLNKGAWKEYQDKESERANYPYKVLN